MIKILKILANHILTVLFFPFAAVIPKNDVVILATSSRYSYKDNTRYLLEYLHQRGMSNIYWVTDSTTIKNHLNNLGIKHIGWKSPLKMIWISLRARIVIDSGNAFFNPFGICSNKKTIKISTMHGNGPKVIISRFHPPNNHRIGLQQIQQYYAFDFLNYPSSYSSSNIGKRVHLLPDKKIISLGYPRCDQYFDKEYVAEKYNDKKITKELCSLVDKNSKVILYTPTWRPYNYDFPLWLMPDLDLEAFNHWLKNKNIFFFFSVHTAQKPERIPDNFQNIIHIDSEKPLYDTNEFLMEVDILINDYSTTSTDFAILKRPQLFFMPDYEFYREDCGFAEEYIDLLPGKEIKRQSELIETLENIILNKDDYLNFYQNKMDELLMKYYDISIENACEKFYLFIKKLLKR